MKIGKALHPGLLVAVMLLSGCAGGGQATDAAVGGPVTDDSAEVAGEDIPVIDLTKRYPERTVDLGEIADIRYVPLETTEKSLISSVTNVAMRDNRIIIYDYEEKKVFIFDGEGRYLRRVSAFGAGPREYLNPHHCAVDFDNELIYIFDFGWPRSTLKVFDFDGYWVRKVDVGEIPSFDEMYLFDNDRLIVRCDPTMALNDQRKDMIGNNPYWFIDVNTGETGNMPIEVDGKAIGANNNVTARTDGGYISMSYVGIKSTHKYDNQVIISEFTDTLAYRGVNGTLVPLVRLIQPEGNDRDQQTLTSISYMTDRFIAFNSVKKRVDRQSGKMEVLNRRYLMYDRENKSVSESYINERDIENGTCDFNSWGQDLPRNTVVHRLPVDFLKWALERDKLKGPLKELADTIDEDANTVLEIVTFK